MSSVLNEGLMNSIDPLMIDFVYENIVKNNIDGFNGKRYYIYRSTYDSVIGSLKKNERILFDYVLKEKDVYICEKKCNIGGGNESYVNSYVYGEISGINANCFQKNKLSSIEFDEFGNVLESDFSKLEKYLDDRFILSDKDWKFYKVRSSEYKKMEEYFGSSDSYKSKGIRRKIMSDCFDYLIGIDIKKILKVYMNGEEFNLSELELEHAILYLGKNNIRIVGDNTFFCEFFDTYFLRDIDVFVLTVTSKGKGNKKKKGVGNIFYSNNFKKYKEAKALEQKKLYTAFSSNYYRNLILEKLIVKIVDEINAGVSLDEFDFYDVFYYVFDKIIAMMDKYTYSMASNFSEDVFGVIKNSIKEYCSLDSKRVDMFDSCCGYFKDGRVSINQEFFNGNYWRGFIEESSDLKKEILNILNKEDILNTCEREVLIYLLGFDDGVFKDIFSASACFNMDSKLILDIYDTAIIKLKESDCINSLKKYVR